MTDYETITYEEDDGVAWVTLDRPDVLNAFNRKMRDELQSLWRDMRWNDDVRVVVLTGAGERAFCTGIDRAETMDPERQQAALDAGRLVDYPTPWTYDDPGFELGPKTNDMWKPVIAAVNGIACGGAFYLLGEAEFIIAADHATFFDPHVTVGMISGYETVHMLPKLPFGELARMVLLGSAERMSAQRAYEIGLVTEVVPGAELRERVDWAARTVASSPALGVQGTVRALWAGLELSRRQAIEVANFLCRIGSDPREMIKAQERFAGGGRPEWRLR